MHVQRLKQWVLLVLLLPWSQIKTQTNTTIPASSRRTTATTTTTTTPCKPIPMENLENAWNMARTTRPKATGMMVFQNGETIFEEYDPSNLCSFFCSFSIFRYLLVDVLGLFPYGGSPTRRFEMWSTTKILSGIAAVVARNYLDRADFLDELVSDYIEQWQRNDDKSTITIGELLRLSSGLATFAQVGYLTSVWLAVASPVVEKRFIYGHAPFIVFSRLLEEALSQDTFDFLNEHFFQKLVSHP